ncbi:MAG: putative Ig domain-containing protein, partial [Pseudomonadota bacterium]
MLTVAVLAFVLTTSTWAAIVIDGLIADWAGVPMLVSDTTGEASPGSDISAVFAKVEGNNLFFRADVMTGPMTVGQTVSFTSSAPAAATIAGATYNVTAAASSGLPVALTIDATASAVCAITGSTVSFTGVGTCVVNANQAGNASFNPAAQVQQSFAVTQSMQTVNVTSSPPVAAAVAGATYTATATASSGLTVALTIDPTASTVCSIAGSTVSFTAVGICTINANQAGNATYSAAPQVQQSFAVAQGSQTVSFTSSTPVAPTVAGATYTVTATASSGLSVALTIDASASAVCAITGSTVSFTGMGTCVINANQAGNVNFNAAPQVQQTCSVNCQTITLTNPATNTGTASTAFSQTVTQSGAAGSATFTTASTLPAGLTLSSAGVLSGTPTQTGTFPIVTTVTDGNGCTGTGSTYSLMIGCQTISLTNPANGSGTASSAFSETVTQSGAIGSATFTHTGTLPAGLTLAANGVLSGTPTQTGSFPIVTTVTDGNGCTGTGSTYSLVIGCQTITLTNPANGSGTASSAFSETITQSGSIGSATFTHTGTLPAGLTL